MYSCETCNTKFTRKWSLRRHITNGCCKGVTTELIIRNMENTLKKKNEELLKVTNENVWLRKQQENIEMLGEMVREKHRLINSKDSELEQMRKYSKTLEGYIREWRKSVTRFEAILNL